METTAQPLARLRARGRLIRGGVLALRLGSLLAPGLAHAARGRLGWACLYGSLAALCLTGGAAAAAAVSCTCPVVTAAVAYALLAAVALVQDLCAVRRPAAAGLLFPGGAALGTGILVAALPFATMALLRALAVDLFVVPSDSMAPTLRPGDTMFVSRLSAATRGAVAVFRDDHERLYVKRIAAVAGDRVEIRRGELWLNGEAAPLLLDVHADDPLVGRYFTRTGGRGHRVLFQRPYLARPSLSPRTVPRGYVFVLGDNRDRSDDSRSYGFVPETALVGRAFALGPRHGDEGLDFGRLGFLL